ncbi:MAG: NUDIX hydrolase [bacterium]|nr:NUDIX hydrolase [bacterium]
MRTFDSLQKELILLEAMPDIDKKVVSLLKERLKKNAKTTRDEGVTDHFCCFVVPIHREKKTIFNGHHIKSGFWIPPGGHIDRSETTQETVKREFKEELRRETLSSPELFDITIAYIENPTPTCTIHYDFWYLVPSEEIDFDYDKKEFYEARWMSIDQAIDLSTTSRHKHVLEKIKKQM